MTVMEVHHRNSGPDAQSEKSSLQLVAILSQDFRNIDQAKNTFPSK